MAKSAVEIEFVPAERLAEWPAVVVVPVCECRHDRDLEAWEFDLRVWFGPEAKGKPESKFCVWAVRERFLMRDRLKRAMELLAQRAAEVGAVKVEIYAVHPPPSAAMLRQREEQKAQVQTTNGHELTQVLAGVR